MTGSNYTTTMVEQELAWVGAFSYEAQYIDLFEKATSSKTKEYLARIELSKNRKLVVSYSSKRARYDQNQRESKRTLQFVTWPFLSYAKLGRFTAHSA